MENNKYDCLCLSLTPVHNFSTLSLLVKLCLFICILKKTDEQIKKYHKYQKKSYVIEMKKKSEFQLHVNKLKPPRYLVSKVLLLYETEICS